jgi:hypothetical protein
MFWNKKDKKKPQKTAKEREPLTREQIIAQAKVNMKAARAEIGDETLEKIKEAMLKKQQSTIEQAKAKIRSTDPHEVRDHLRTMIREDK